MKNNVEITKEAFKAIVQDTVASSVVEKEFARFTYFFAKGCRLLQLENHCAGVVQFYIQDIND